MFVLESEYMAEVLVNLDEKTVKRWIRERRTPIIIEGWSGGAYAEVPPKGGTGRVELLNEQIGEFTTGYGKMIPLTEEQADWLKLIILEASQSPSEATA
jgi:hypothetical protein